MCRRSTNDPVFLRGCVCACVDTSLVSRVTGWLTYRSAAGAGAGIGSKPPKPGCVSMAAGVAVKNLLNIDSFWSVFASTNSPTFLGGGLLVYTVCRIKEGLFGDSSRPLEESKIPNTKARLTHAHCGCSPHFFCTFRLKPVTITGGFHTSTESVHYNIVLSCPNSHLLWGKIRRRSSNICIYCARE